MVELKERYPEYEPSTMIWPFTINFFLAASLGKFSYVDKVQDCFRLSEVNKLISRPR